MVIKNKKKLHKLATKVAEVSLSNMSTTEQRRVAQVLFDSAAEAGLQSRNTNQT